MAAAAPPRRIGRSSVHMDGGSAHRPTPAIDGAGGKSSGAGAGRRPGINLFSGPVCAAVFVSFALCIVVFCVYSFLARRRAIAGIRQRILRHISESDVDLAFRRLARPPPPAATTAYPADVPPPSLVPTTPPPAATRGTGSEMPSPPLAAPSSQETVHTNSGPGNCPVCLEPLHGGSNIMAAYACSHVFHAPCIEPWLRQSGPCLVCRCTINSTFTFNSTSNPIPTSNFTSTSNPIPTSTSILIPTSNSNSTSNSRADMPRSPRAATTHSRPDVPPLPQAATLSSRIDVPPAPREETPPPPSRAAPVRRPQGANSNTTTNSGLGNCPVCHEPLHGHTNIMAAHACAHVFHASCIEPWLHNRGSCPVCRCTANPTSDSNSTSNSDFNFTSTPTPSSNSTSTPIGDCPVCLEPLHVGSDDVRAAHACGHVFHSRCIEPWLHQQDSCPVCRCTINSTSSNPNSTINSTSSNPNSTFNSTSTSSPIGYCPVCLEPLHADSGDIRAAHVCGHVFHSRCIELWVRQRGSCYVCRCTIVFNSNSGGECPMCLKPLLVGGGDVRAAHVCGHMFHSHCIELWLCHRNSCPVCRCTETTE